MARVTLRRLLSAALLLVFIVTSVHLISNQPRRSDASDFSAATKAWTAALAEIDSAEAKQRQAKVGGSDLTTGIVLIGAGKQVRSAVGAVRFLRRVGCLLPVEFAYFPHEVAQSDLDLLRMHNITPRDYYSDEVRKWNWDKSLLALGAAKPYAIFTSPFDRVLFLDPDVMALRDPTYLFDTNAFKTYGALFWPDFPTTSPRNPIWKIANISYHYEREFESGIIAINKQHPGILRALSLSVHICAHASYYFSYIYGDKDAFRWAFKMSKTPYFLNPNYLSSLGLLVDSAHPKGGASLTAHRESFFSSSMKLRPPKGVTYCGQNMLQLDFLDLDDTSSIRKEQRKEKLWSYDAKPLFLHANGIKKHYDPHVPPFQVIQRYSKPSTPGVSLDALRKGRYDWIGDVFETGHCGAFREEKGVDLVYERAEDVLNDVSEVYMKVRDEIEKL